jgi:hypothetical protein
MDDGNPNITLQPGNNLAQIELSDGVEYTNFLTYEKMRIADASDNLVITNKSITATTLITSPLLISALGGNLNINSDTSINLVSTVNGSITLTAGPNNDGTNIIDLDAPYGNVNITSGANISLSATGAILTDSKIATLNGFPTNVGSSIDFGGANPDYNFTISKDIIDLNYNNTITQGNQQIFQDPITQQAFFRQQFSSAGNTLETLIRNDINSNSIKLSEIASSAKCEITKDEIDMVDGSGFILTLSSGGLTSTNAITLTSVGAITLTPTTSVVSNTQIQMPTTSGTISYSNITGFLSIDFASQSTGYFELSNLPAGSISGLTLTNGRIGGEYHILLRGQLGFNWVPSTSSTFKANNYSLSTSNGSEWIGLKIYFTNTLSQYLINATLYT